MSKVDEVNANNFMVAQIGGVCYQHKYEPTSNLVIKRCSECGMKTLNAQGEKGE